MDKIKNLGTDKAYEKNRLFVQAYNSKDKNLVPIQSPTIKQVSQRLIVCLAAKFKDNDNIQLYLRDIMQANVQSTSDMNRDFCIQPLFLLISLLGASSDFIIKVIKLLYGVSKVGIPWFASYHTYNKGTLGMTKSKYDPCLLYRSSTLAIV